MQTRQNERSDSGQTDWLEDQLALMHLYAAVSPSISSAEPEFVLWIACSRRSKPLLQQPRHDSSPDASTYSSPKHEKFLQLEEAARFACWRICLRKPAFCKPHYHSCPQHTMDFQPRSAGRGSNPKLCFFVFTKLSFTICCVALEICFTLFSSLIPCRLSKSKATVKVMASLCCTRSNR